jgi:hypothetical protein
MQPSVSDPMLISKLNDVCVKHFGAAWRAKIIDSRPPFDISQPNLHDRKSDFSEEFELVKSVIEHCDSMLFLLTPKDTDESVGRKEMLLRIERFTDREAKNKLLWRGAKSAKHLAFGNMVQVGFFNASLKALHGMRTVYQHRFDLLLEQEVTYWSLKNRAPNYYARTIALRFARLYAKHREMKPTFGMAAAGSHPSTDYGQAIEEIFKILAIEEAYRNAAKWAVKQIVEEDWNPKLRSGIFPPLGAAPPPWRPR